MEESAPSVKGANTPLQSSLYSKYEMTTVAPSLLRTDPPWGFQASVQFVVICIIASLLFNAFGDHSSQRIETLPVLLQFDNHIHEIIQRSNKATGDWIIISDNDLPRDIGAWSLAALLSTLFSAAMVFMTCLFGWKEERAKLRIIMASISVIGVLLILVTAPLLYGTLKRPDGTQILFDAAVSSLFIYISGLVINLAGALDWPQQTRQRHSYMVFIVAVDLPCIIVTSTFVFFGLSFQLPPVFTVGTAAALLAYSSVVFLLLSGYNWTQTNVGMAMLNRLNSKTWRVIALGAALNVTMGTFVQWIKLPIYLDLVGSFVVAGLCGAIPAALSALLGVLFLSVTTTPIALAYVGTAILVAIVAAKLVPYSFLKNRLRTCVLGLCVLGPLSTIASVPVTIYLFGGITFVGIDAVTVVLRESGLSLIESVASGALLFDALDKGLAAYIAFEITRRVPDGLIKDLKA